MNDPYRPVPMYMSASTGAPWHHYVGYAGAMLIGWAIAAFMYTY